MLYGVSGREKSASRDLYKCMYIYIYYFTFKFVFVSPNDRYATISVNVFKSIVDVPLLISTCTRICLHYVRYIIRVETRPI